MRLTALRWFFFGTNLKMIQKMYFPGSSSVLASLVRTLELSRRAETLQSALQPREEVVPYHTLCGFKLSLSYLAYFDPDG